MICPHGHSGLCLVLPKLSFGISQSLDLSGRKCYAKDRQFVNSTACSCRPNSCWKCKGLGFSVTFRMFTSSAIGKDTASHNKTALQLCEIKVFITLTAEIYVTYFWAIFSHLLLNPQDKRKKKKGQEGKNSILLSGLISFFVFHQMKKVRGLQVCFFFLFFFANGHKRSIRISENRKCNTNHKCKSKKISVFFILQMKPQIYNPLYTVESGFKTTCCLPMI